MQQLQTQQLELDSEKLKAQLADLHMQAATEPPPHFDYLFVDFPQGQMLKQMDDMSLKEELAALYAGELSEGEAEGSRLSCREKVTLQ